MAEEIGAFVHGEISDTRMEKIMVGMQDEELKEWKRKGQDYADYDGSNALANFDRIAERSDMDPSQVLMIYCEKHMDAIWKWTKRKTTATEDIRGRIKDVRVYMALLRALVDRYYERENVVKSNGNDLGKIKQEVKPGW